MVLTVHRSSSKDQFKQWSFVYLPNFRFCPVVPCFCDRALRGVCCQHPTKADG